MLVIVYNRNEIATLRLVKTYCVHRLPTVMYGFETWYLDYNVMWNNYSFRRILVVVGVKVCHVFCFTVNLPG